MHAQLGTELHFIATATATLYSVLLSLLPATLCIVKERSIDLSNLLQLLELSVCYHKRYKIVFVEYR